MSTPADPQPGPDTDAVLRLQRELQKESDRGAVLVAGAMLEDALREMLLAYLVPNPSTSDSLFDGPNAPLQSFSAKIDAAYRLGRISDRFCRDLHVIRRIRNDVAHRAASCSFDDVSLKDRVHALTKSHGMYDRSPQFVAERGVPDIRRQFIEAASWMLFFLTAERHRVEPMNARTPEFGYEYSHDRRIAKKTPV